MLVLRLRRKWNWRKITADGAAFLLYLLGPGLSIPAYEWYCCGLGVEQVAMLRIMSGAPRALLGFLCGSLKDVVKERMFRGASGFWQEAAAGAIALFVFQLPFYLAGAWIMRAGMRQILITCALYVAGDIGFGWWYAALLTRMRRCFHAERDS